MKKKILILTGIILCLIFLAAYFTLYTEKGSEVVSAALISKYSGDSNITYESVTGTLSEGLNYKNIEVLNLKGFPSGTKVKIQRLFVKLENLDFKNILAEIENARLMLPDSNTLVVSGGVTGRKLDINCYSNGFNINEIAAYLPDLKALVPVKGEVVDIDLYVKGNYFEPEITGDFKIKEFLYKGFILTDSPWNIDIVLKEINNDVELFGQVNIRDGNLRSQKSLIKEVKGSIKFAGQWDQPSFSLSGNSKIEKTKISIGLKGTLNKPEINLTSEPPFSGQKLMVMLATGKSWKSVENTIDTGTISLTGLTKDFIDYYFFAGKTNKFAQRLGVHDVSVKFQGDTKGIEAKKDVTDKLEVGYGIEQQTSGQQEKTTTQTIQGEYKVTDTVSVGAEKEVKKTTSLEELGPAQNEVNNDKVYLKYKKNF